MAEEFLSYCLNEIEKKETSLLVWGLVDSYFSHYDLYDFLEPILQDAVSNNLTDILDTELLIEKLIEKGLIHRFNDENYENYFYRSRMAETVRLMSKLRQLFPEHAGNNAWRGGATLVADYRFQSRPRKFPKRNLSIHNLLKQIEYLNIPDTQLELIKSLIGDNFKLSGFQVRAIRDILGKVNNNKNSGSIVCAGTGSGKTLSFYLPSLTRIGFHIINDSQPWVKALAIYPRNELLKDQFSEIYAESRKLDSVLKSKLGRKIIIGAFFGPTPKDNKIFLTPGNNQLNGWQPSRDGYYCEYIRCITIGCNGKLNWSASDIKNGIERLKCDNCKHVINEDEIILTRKRMKNNPPDILFTSTEMLNQRMSDNEYRNLFGIGSGVRKSPEFMLLDEVHTYSGLHGAQVAYLIRRWHYLVGRNVVFVGLSATLNNAQEFFATLVGLDTFKVDEISPEFEELEKKGAEYNLVLRGDPVSRKSLLSTTIQTTMLTSRVLDERERHISDGYFGSKTFVFTDDIDVTNRLYFNTLDAEGRDSWGASNTRQEGGLAYLREEGTNFTRYEYGQDWRFCENINHNLRDRMNIGRTSSQDPGTSSQNDIIIATASLEVGFNDPEVGAVIQHKAPHDMAQFIQRKGRAGRSTTMRPWTIVVLSDYGRDRSFYQSYEQIFDPELKTRYIPINNRHVQRMQSIYSLIDYLGVQLQGFKKGSVWKDLSTPLTGKFKNYEDDVVQERLKLIKKELENILTSDQAFKKFQFHLSDTLKLKNKKNVLDDILWDFPRSLMTIVIPKIIKRIDSNWAINGKRISEVYKFNSPLMEFIPATLFSDLNLPEVEIVLSRADNEENTVLMPVFHALKDFAPGRVSKRFTIQHRYISHWISDTNLNPGVSQYSLEINNFSTTNFIGEFNISNNNLEVSKIKVYRPLKLTPTRPGNNIGDTSNATLNWFTEMVTEYKPAILGLPKSGIWSNIVKDIEFYLHNNHNPVEVRRFSTGSTASITIRGENVLDADFNFVNNEESVALGVSQFVDGILFKLKISDDLLSTINKDKWSSLRVTRYYDLANKGEDFLQTINNYFTREWLSQIYLMSVISVAIDQNLDIGEAVQVLKGNSGVTFEEILSIIFQLEIIHENSNALENSDFQDELRVALMSHLSDENILLSLENLFRATILSEIDASWQKWTKEHYISTLASAISNAIEQLCKDLDTSSLITDIQHLHINSISEIDEIWITEDSSGGIGVIEELITRYGENNKRFWGLVQSALEITESELVDKQLRKVIKLSNSNENLRECFNKIRERKTVETDKHLEELKQILNNEGINIYHSFMSSLNTRILRPGSSDQSDDFIENFIEIWKSEEKRLDIEIDLKIIAYHISKLEITDTILDIDNIQNMPYLKYNMVYGLLWPKGREIRQQSLSLYNQFHKLPVPDRLFISDYFESDINVVNINQNEDWKGEILKYLSEKGNTRILCPINDKYKIKDVFNFIMTNPVEDEYLMIYPSIKSVKNDSDNIEINIEITEAL